VGCCWPHTVHISTVVVGTRGGECTVRDAFGVEAEADFLRVVLSYWQSTRDDLGLMSVVPTMHVGVRVILAGRLFALQVCVVEDLGRVRSGLAFLQWCGHYRRCVYWVQCCMSEVVSRQGRTRALGAYDYICDPSGNGSCVGRNQNHLFVGALRSWWH
jgi:hypothetical protein